MPSWHISCKDNATREDEVDDRGRIAMAIGLGALVGGVAGYLLLTERGRQMRDELEPRLNDVLGEVDKLRQTFESTRSAVSEGWRSFNQLMEQQKPAAQPSSQSATAQSAARKSGDIWSKDVGGQPH
jgi:gas vesicle protein